MSESTVNIVSANMLTLAIICGATAIGLLVVLGIRKLRGGRRLGEGEEA